MVTNSVNTQKEKTNKVQVSDRVVAYVFLIFGLIGMWAQFKIPYLWLQQVIIVIVAVCFAFFAYGLTLTINPNLDKKIREGFAVCSLLSILGLLFFYYSAITFNQTLTIIFLVISGFLLFISFVGWLLEKQKISSTDVYSNFGLLTPFLFLLIGALLITRSIILFQILLAIMVLFSLDITIEIVQNSSPSSSLVGSLKNLFKPQLILKLTILFAFFLILNQNLDYFLSTPDFLKNYLSTMIQVLATILSILIAFVTMLSPSAKLKEYRGQAFSQGIRGFTLYFLIILIFCLLLFSLKINFTSLYSLQGMDIRNILSNIDLLQSLLGVALFEVVFLSIPLGILYLYALVRDFLVYGVDDEGR